MANKLTIKDKFEIFKDVAKDKDAQLAFGSMGIGVIGIASLTWGMYNAVSVLVEGKSSPVDKKKSRYKNMAIGLAIGTVCVFVMGKMASKLDSNLLKDN